jgi:DNA repair protein RadC
MKAVAAHDRPREKLARLGSAALGDNELVAIVLGRALDLANAVLAEAGGLHGLVRIRYEALTRLPGIGAVRAAQVAAAIELGRRTLTRAAIERPQLITARQVAEYLLPLYGAQPVEHFGVVLFDTKRRVLRTRVLSVGTLDASVVHPREVFREAVAANASALILFHNHPSGDPAPSDEDLELTIRMIAAGVLMGIDVIDHIVLGDVRFCSLRDRLKAE